MIADPERRIETDRLLLRKFGAADLDEYFLVMSQDEVGGQLPKGRGFTLEETTAMVGRCIEHGSFVVRKVRGRRVGVSIVGGRVRGRVYGRVRRRRHVDADR